MWNSNWNGINGVLYISIFLELKCAHTWLMIRQKHFAFQWFMLFGIGFREFILLICFQGCVSVVLIDLIMQSILITACLFNQNIWVLWIARRHKYVILASLCKCLYIYETSIFLCTYTLLYIKPYIRNFWTKTSICKFRTIRTSAEINAIKLD